MKIVAVQHLDIFECAYVKGRGDSTLVSLRADGRASHTVSLPRQRTPASGGPTVAAYLDAEMKTLHAWLDPVSGEYFVANAHMPRPAFFATIVAIVLALNVMALMHVDDRRMGGTMACLAVGAVIALVRQKLRDRRLESTLRTTLPR